MNKKILVLAIYSIVITLCAVWLIGCKMKIRDSSVEELTSTSSINEVHAAEQTEKKMSEETSAEHKEEPKENETELLCDTPIDLTDIYSEVGNTVEFQCYDSAADAYQWEIYNMNDRKWEEAAAESFGKRIDELGREISFLSIPAESSNNALMVACEMSVGKEQKRQTASLYLLKSKIEELEIEHTDAEAGEYMNVNDIPVKLQYADGSSEVLKGIYGLYFVSGRSETVDSTRSVSGNRIETTTTIVTEGQYQNISLGANEVHFRYHPFDDDEKKVVELNTYIDGKDTSAPEIIDVKISPYEISNVDQPVSLTVEIEAEDGITPYPHLEYAFLSKEQIPEEEDWGTKAAFDVEIQHNGIYIFYVRDEYGNIASEEREIVTVDTKSPVITEILYEKDEWCKSNKVIVSATDYGDMNYRFFCEDVGEDTGWITNNEYYADKNGKWCIQVKDSAGNISEETVEITNIDNVAPIIQQIVVVE